MGIYSTLYVSRKAVKDAIKEYLDMDKATNNELADALWILSKDKTLYNYRIDNDNNGLDDELLKAR